VTADVTVTDPNGACGFEYFDNSGSPPAITSVAVSENSIRITLASAPTGKNGRVRYAYSSVLGNWAGPTTGPRGCLHDSDPAVGAITGKHLYNWCVHFDLPVATNRSPWSPLDVADCRLYLDADTIGGNTGDPVSNWTDQSGYGYTPTQSNPAKQPSLVTADAEFNGHNSIQFAASRLLQFTNLYCEAKKTIFLIGRTTGTHSGEWAADFSIGLPWPYSANGFSRTLWQGNIYRIHVRGPGAADRNNFVSPSGTYLLNVLYDTNSTPLYVNGILYPDNTARGVSAGGLSGPGGIFVGGAGGSNPDAVNAKIAAIIVYGRVLSEAERLAVANWLKAKYGL
jgi:hypothetical protein